VPNEDTSIELASVEARPADPHTTAVYPVSYVPGDEKEKAQDGIGLCLSGGGSRAMVFHLGALLRLNELGLLHEVNRVSGVSGGSITGGVLGLGWHDLDWRTDAVTGGQVASNLQSIVLDPIEAFAAKSVDVHAVIEGILHPGENAADRLDRIFDEHLYHGKTLQDLPDDPDGPNKGPRPGPRFIFNATNLSSSVLWRFSKPYCWDWRVGEIEHPPFRVSTAVAASAAFPPFFAPLELEVKPSDFTPGTGKGLELSEYQRKIPLADGGVYDNLALETVFKRYHTIFASDGGGQVSDDPSPPTDWVRETLRMTSVIDHQVRSLRKRLLIAAYQRKDRTGAYWAIRQVFSDDPLDPQDPPIPPGRLPCPPGETMALANLPTRLDGMTPEIRDRLVNWGYAVTDAAIRTWYDDKLPPPKGFPRPGGVG
jgi:NTE family protein